MYSEFPEAQVQKLGEPGSNAQKHKKKKKKNSFLSLQPGDEELASLGQVQAVL